MAFAAGLRDCPLPQLLGQAAVVRHGALAVGRPFGVHPRGLGRRRRTAQALPGRGQPRDRDDSRRARLRAHLVRRDARRRRHAPHAGGEPWIEVLASAKPVAHFPRFKVRADCTAITKELYPGRRRAALCPGWELRRRRAEGGAICGLHLDNSRNRSHDRPSYLFSFGEQQGVNA
jgi:hypothetical protein